MRWRVSSDTGRVAFKAYETVLSATFARLATSSIVDKDDLSKPEMILRQIVEADSRSASTILL
jgi:hypothetical protein